MSNIDESSSACSTCSASNDDYDDVEEESYTDSQSEDETCLNESDLRWMNKPCDQHGSLFYFDAPFKPHEHDEQPQEQEMKAIDKLETKSASTSHVTLDANQRMRSSISSYTKLASWVFDSKHFNRNKKEPSLKRKSSKKTIDNEKKESKQTAKDKLLPSIEVSSENNNDETLIQLIQSGDNYINDASRDSPSDHFVLLYLTPPNENNASEKDCLAFSYPKQANHDRNPVVLKLKGMFITMSQVVNQITNQFPVLSTISITKEGEEKEYLIGFAHEFSSMLAIALPLESCSQIEMKTLVATIARMIRFLYNSLDAAFKNESNHAKLAQLFAIVNHIIKKDEEKDLFENDDQSIRLFLNSIPRLLIDDDLYLQTTDAMSEYESMDWTDHDHCYKPANNNISHEQSSSSSSSQDLIVIGSCLLYKSHLVASHLPSNYLLDIIGFLRLKGLLECFSYKLVTWNEVFPTSVRRNDSNDYPLSEGVRYALAVIGSENLLHCILLEMPFASNMHEDNQIKPNEKVINESIRFLSFCLIKSGIIDDLSHFLNLTNPIASNENANQSTIKLRPKSFTSLKDLIPSFSPSIPSIFHSTNSLLSVDHDESTTSVSESQKSISSPSLQQSFISRTSSGSTSLCASNTASTNCTPNINGLHDLMLRKRLSLPEHLVCYLDIENEMQIISGPIMLNTNQTIRDEFSKKFYSTCFNISNQLRSENINENNSISELGMTFQLKLTNESRMKKSRDMCMFYVVGRVDVMLNNEFYVCFMINNNDLSLDIDVEQLAYDLRISRRLA